MYQMVKLLSMTKAGDALLARIMDDVAVNGLQDRSLRDLAAAVGTSHRLLIYHFGSREGLVAAIVATMEAQQRELFRAAAESIGDPVDLVRDLWQSVSAEAVRPFVRLFFEAVAYTGHQASGDGLTGQWLEDTREVTARIGVPFDPVWVRLGIAVVRGLLIDVVVTGDVAAATASLERFLQQYSPAP